MSIPPAVPPPFSAESPSQDDRIMAMLAYILGIFTGFLGPLVIWLIKKDQSKFVNYHGLQALIFHTVIVAGYLLSNFAMVFLIGFLTYPACVVLSLVFSILAALAASRGEWYVIPVVGPWVRQQVGV